MPPVNLGQDLDAERHREGVGISKSGRRVGGERPDASLDDPPSRRFRLRELRPAGGGSGGLRTVRDAGPAGKPRAGSSEARRPVAPCGLGLRHRGREHRSGRRRGCEVLQPAADPRLARGVGGSRRPARAVRRADRPRLPGEHTRSCTTRDRTRSPESTVTSASARPTKWRFRVCPPRLASPDYS